MKDIGLKENSMEKENLFHQQARLNMFFIPMAKRKKSLKRNLIISVITSLLQIPQITFSKMKEIKWIQVNSE